MKIKSFGLCKVLLLDKAARPALFYSLSSQPHSKIVEHFVSFQWKNTSGLAIFSQHFSQRNIFISPCVRCWLLAIGLVHTPPACNPLSPNFYYHQQLFQHFSFLCCALLFCGYRCNWNMSNTQPLSPQFLLLATIVPTLFSLKRCNE